MAAIAAAGFALTLAKFYQLYVKKDHHVRRLRNGLPELLFLALAWFALRWWLRRVEDGQHGARIAAGA